MKGQAREPLPVRFLSVNFGTSAGSRAATRHRIIAFVLDAVNPDVIFAQECSLATNNLLSKHDLDPNEWQVSSGDDARLLWRSSRVTRQERIGNRTTESIVEQKLGQGSRQGKLLLEWGLRSRIRIVLLNVTAAPSSFVLVVSWHGPNVGSGLTDEKKSEIFVALVQFIEAIRSDLLRDGFLVGKRLTVVLGGDFNFDIANARQNLPKSMRYILPSYEISERRQEKRKGYQCIDYFVFGGNFITEERRFSVRSFHLDSAENLNEVMHNVDKVSYIVENNAHVDHDPVLAVIDMAIAVQVKNKQPKYKKPVATQKTHLKRNRVRSERSTTTCCAKCTIL